jgi:hypothetical protein
MARTIRKLQLACLATFQHSPTARLKRQDIPREANGGLTHLVKTSAAFWNPKLKHYQKQNATWAPYLEPRESSHHVP